MSKFRFLAASGREQLANSETLQAAMSEADAWRSFPDGSVSIMVMRKGEFETVAEAEFRQDADGSGSFWHRWRMIG